MHLAELTAYLEDLNAEAEHRLAEARRP